jgi:hypothetical protein
MTSEKGSKSIIESSWRLLAKGMSKAEIEAFQGIRLEELERILGGD